MENEKHFNLNGYGYPPDEKIDFSKWRFKKSDLIICDKCEVHHYENCPKCFGFGQYKNIKGDLIPITAYEAELYRDGKVSENKLSHCEFCDSNIYGIQ
jgi:hypothetical protein